ncbi:uncharacterized protein ACN2A1_007606 isoform 1-T1 [Glossina fuscipes fuscipes]
MEWETRIVAGLQYCEIYSSAESDVPPMRHDDWKDVRLWLTFFLGLASYSFFKLKLYRTVARYLKGTFQRNAFVKLLIISSMMLTVFSSFLFVWSLQKHAIIVQPLATISKISDVPEDLYITQQDVFGDFDNEKENIQLPVEIDTSQPGNPDNLNRKTTQSHYDDYAKIKIRLRNDVSPALSLPNGEMAMEHEKWGTATVAEISFKIKDLILILYAVLTTISMTAVVTFYIIKFINTFS